MCGIFGVIVKSGSSRKAPFIKQSLKKMASISIARGQDSSGIVFKHDQGSGFSMIRGDIPVTQLLKSPEFTTQLNASVSLYEQGSAFQAIGHARLVTNGSQLKDVNNQPVVKNGVIGIHNGIIVNNDQIWKNHPELVREYDIDTEVLLALIKSKLSALSLPDAINQSLREVEGTVSCVLFFEDRHEIALFTNNGSLYYILEQDLLLIASEEYFLKKVFEGILPSAKINHLAAFEGLILNTSTFKASPFHQQDQMGIEYTSGLHTPYQLDKTTLKGNFDQEMVIDPMEFIDRSKERDLYGLLENNATEIDQLKRCTRCILPETFPFIEFDHEGECNYCRNYKPQPAIQSFDSLRSLVAPYKRSDGRSDCIVPFSGGRDSTYSLHIVKKELGLNPIAFTYDWGMVTDLARRNIARVCGKLGVENIIVSADIKWKRENIRKNVLAWLKNPELGMIPLFMAGDKYFFYYCNRLKKQTGIDLNIWGINRLENTDFKTGFAGIRPESDKEHIYSLSIAKQLKLFGFVAGNIIKSPGYLNQSVFDSLGSFAVRYLAPKKDYFHLFDYYKWDEKELESIIQKEYNWEKAIDTDSTWRIGDGTASFYNYIYYTVAGFTENDTFRSNQIREGMITREEALQKLNRENEARYETLRWYLEIIGLDFREVIQVINKIPKLYRHAR